MMLTLHPYSDSHTTQGYRPSYTNYKINSPDKETSVVRWLWHWQLVTTTVPVNIVPLIGIFVFNLFYCFTLITLIKKLNAIFIILVCYV